MNTACVRANGDYFDKTSKKKNVFSDSTMFEECRPPGGLSDTLQYSPENEVNPLNKTKLLVWFVN